MKIVVKMKNLLARLFFSIYSAWVFPRSIKIYGDPHKLKIGKRCTFRKGVIIYTAGGYVEIGDDCEINHGVILNASGGSIVIGNQSSLNPYCIVYGDGHTLIGNGVRIAAHTVIVSSNHSFLNKMKPILQQGFTKKGIIIKDDVWIGAGVSILDGVTINQGVVVGAGSVVTKSLPAYSVCVGVPAQIVKYRE